MIATKIHNLLSILVRMVLVIIVIAVVVVFVPVLVDGVHGIRVSYDVGHLQPIQICHSWQKRFVLWIFLGPSIIFEHYVASCVIPISHQPIEKNF